MNLQMFEEAVSDCKTAIKISPNDKVLRQHWELIAQ